MWYSRRSSISIFIYCGIAFITAKNDCDQQVKDFNWEPMDGPSPAHIYEKGPRNGDANRLVLGITNVTENLTVTAYVNPFINSTNCPERPLTTRDLYKFWSPASIQKGRNVTWILAEPLSGCYYVQMTNAAEHNFLARIPAFLNSSTHFYDWNLKCMNSEFVPANEKANAQFKLTLEIPLKCLKIEIRLFEFSKPINSKTKHDSGSGEGPPIGNCSFTEKSESCDSSSHKIDFNIRRSFPTEKEKWIVDITWSNLKKGGAYYYSDFKIMNNTCKMKSWDVATWKPAYILHSIDHGKQEGDNSIKSPPNSTADIGLIFYILLGLISIAISIYWIKKFVRILIKLKKPSNPLPEEDPAEVVLSDHKILLIYMSSSSDLMKTIACYRSRLQKEYHYQVCDIFSKTESVEAAKLGATVWVAKMLKVNSKVIWFDTPEFRSVCNDNNLNKEKQNGIIWRDHRVAAIPYALSLTKHLFQDVTTQYRHHFVVRLEGHDITNENEDPLLLVSPGVRYCLPQNFDALCADLNK